MNPLLFCQEKRKRKRVSRNTPHLVFFEHVMPRGGPEFGEEEKEKKKRGGKKRVRRALHVSFAVTTSNKGKGEEALILLNRKKGGRGRK